MSGRWSCPHGHQWAPPIESPIIVPPPAACPVCGGPLEPLVPPTLNEPPPTRDEVLTVPSAPSAGDVGLPQIPGYDLLSVIGRGGMGIVYKAHHRSLDRVVALKRMLAGPDADERERGRFRREAEAMARLHHPHIVQVHEIGAVDDCPFLVMDFIEGGSLAQQIERGQLGQPLEAARLVESLARTMHYAHQHDVVHRDLKPGNVLLTPDGTPKVVDFGLARRLDRDSSLDASGVIVGTPSYMAPEQAGGQSKHVGPLADVYALGAILYHLLTGRPPFEGANTWEVVQSVLTQEPVALRKRRQDVPRDLETICLKCLRKEPTERYGSAEELADDLRRFQAGEPIRARPVGRLERLIKWGRRRPQTAALVAALGLLLVLGAGFGFHYWDTHHRLKVVHYAHFVRHRHGPKGIGRLGPDEVTRRSASLRCSERGGRIERMEVINGHGVLNLSHSVTAVLDAPSRLPSAHKECIYDFTYNEHHELTHETARSRTGRVMWVLHHATPTTGYFADARGFPRARAGSGAAFVEWTFSARGYETSARYFDRNGKPQPDHEQVFGYAYEVDERGQIVEATILDAAGRPAMHPHGYARQRHQYDQQGNILSTSLALLDGSPAIHRDGYTTVQTVFDAFGNQTESVTLNAAGQPVVTREGYARQRYTTNHTGDVVEMTVFDAEDRPALNSNGVSRYRLRHDDEGRTTELSCFDRTDIPTVHSYGYFKVLWEYDAAGNLASMSWRDRQDQPTVTANGYARVQYAYDARGNRTGEDYFGRDGQPTLHKDGDAAIRIEYDERDNQHKTTHLDRAGQPTITRNGYARTVNSHDDRGNLTQRFFFGRRGEPVRDSAGVSVYRWVFDDRGNITETRRHGPHDEPTRNKAGVFRDVSRHNERGLVVATTYFGPNGQPARHVDGNARYTADYDAQGNRVEERFFDADGKALTLNAGYAAWRGTYDSRGRLLKQVFLDEHNKPVRTKEGYAWVESRYDERGHPLQLSYFGPDGAPALNTQGVFRMTFKHDDRGNLLERAYFDQGNQPTEGWALEKMTYDDRGLRTSVTFIDKHGQLARNYSGSARVENDYDERGNQIRLRRFDTNNQPMPDVARVEWKYNDWGEEIEQASFDRNGRLVDNGSGYARKVIRHDEAGNAVREEYFDTSDRLRAGWARCDKRHDARRNVVEESYFDANGQRSVGRQGFWRARYVYNDYDARSDANYDDMTGQPIRTKAVVVQVNVGGQGQRLGLQDGDIVLRYDGGEVANEARLREQRRTEPIENRKRPLIVLRNGKELVFEVEPGVLDINPSSTLAIMKTANSRRNSLLCNASF